MENDRLDYKPLDDLIKAGLSPSSKILKNFSDFVRTIKIRRSFYLQLLADYDSKKAAIAEGGNDVTMADHRFSSLLILETFIRELTANLMRRGINFSEASLLPTMSPTGLIVFDDEEG